MVLCNTPVHALSEHHRADHLPYNISNYNCETQQVGCVPRAGRPSPRSSQRRSVDTSVLGGFPVGIPGEEKTLRASKGQFSSERLLEAFPPLVLHLRSSSNHLCRATLVALLLSRYTVSHFSSTHFRSVARESRYTPYHPGRNYYKMIP